ncbi:hypothetical protein D3C83_97890 [compost metagenome]
MKSWPKYTLVCSLVQKIPASRPITPIENTTAPRMARALNMAVSSGTEIRPARKRGKAMR